MCLPSTEATLNLHVYIVYKHSLELQSSWHCIKHARTILMNWDRPLSILKIHNDIPAGSLSLFPQLTNILLQRFCTEKEEASDMILFSLRISLPFQDVKTIFFEEMLKVENSCQRPKKYAAHKNMPDIRRRKLFFCISSNLIRFCKIYIYIYILL